jgi:L-ascorbate metabolism protein UlaG (beta-lactamase superfamily)
MVITYYGASCFKIQSGETVIVFDPPSKKSEFKSPRFQADVVFVSHNHPNHNGSENIPSSKKTGADGKPAEPFIVEGPGEYEVGGAPIRGIPSFHDAENGKKYGLNTIYSLEVESVRLCHLGDLGEKELRPETIEAIGEVDVLFVPIAGSVEGAEHAAKFIQQIEPKIIIPMHYFVSGGKTDKKRLVEFLKEMGREKTQPSDRFTFKRKDIEEKEGEIVVLEPALS